MFRADAFIDALREFQPDVLAACQAAMRETHDDGDFVRINTASFEEGPDISIDYAVMEKTH